MTTNWQDLDRTAKGDLIRPYILEQQLSYSQIAKIIGVSRVAIAGAADRNNITSPYSRGVTGKGNKGIAAVHARMAATKRKKPGKQPTAPKRFNRFVAEAIPEAAIDKTPLFKGAWVPLPGTTPKPLDQHKEHTCRWPLGDQSPFTFCCAKVEDGSSWCPAHRKLAFKPRPAPKFNGRKTTA